jgi:tetratricopeptide (TPR) repeat protein
MRALSHPVLPLVFAFLLSSLVAQDSSPQHTQIDSAEFDAKRISRSVNSQLHPRNEMLPCFRWPMRPIASGMVSVIRLDVPSEAQKEYSEACNAVLKNKLPDAEQHLNQAVGLYPKFAAAWVLLGQVQEDQGRTHEAEQSCSRARDADSVYLGSYLCLADLAARKENWPEVVDLTNHALQLHPVRAPGAYYYNSLAYLSLKQGSLAEERALRVAEDPELKKRPSIHLLLAKIYELKGDRDSEANQLRQYLKLAPHTTESDVIRKILREIVSHATDSAQTKLPVE